MTTAAQPVKLDALRKAIRDLGSVVVCYSGGIDSALVLAVAHEQLGDRAIGLTATSPSLPRSERLDAARIAGQIGVRHEWVESHELLRPGYVANEPDRCLHCKTELYELAEAKRQEWGLHHIANGANVEDLGDYRPGLQAAHQAGVRSPLIEAQLTKQDIREAALALELEVWDKPASACLSSRIPYGTSVTAERLAQIEGFEAVLKSMGFRQVRVRWHDTIARVELPLGELPRALESDLREHIVRAGKQHGFKYVTLDLAGYRQGSHNEVLVGRNLKTV